MAISPRLATNTLVNRYHFILFLPPKDLKPRQSHYDKKSRLFFQAARR
jgi:hypothetical protein